MVLTFSVWIPDLTVCGDVESNPGPTWKEIRNLVLKKEGKENPKLNKELDKLEDNLNSAYSNVVVITDTHIKEFLKSQERKVIDRNVRKLVAEVIKTDAALLVQAGTVREIQWQIGDPVQVMRSGGQFDPGWTVISVDDAFINVEKNGDKGNMSKNMARSKADQWLRIDVSDKAAVGSAAAGPPAPPAIALSPPRPGTPPARRPGTPPAAIEERKVDERTVGAYGPPPPRKPIDSDVRVVKVSKLGRGGSKLANAWAARMAEQQDQKHAELDDLARLKTFRSRLGDIDVSLRKKKISSALGAIQDTVGIALRGVPIRIELDTVMAHEQAVTVMRDMEKELQLSEGRLQVQMSAVPAPSTTISVVVSHDDDHRDGYSSEAVVKNIGTHVVKMLRHQTEVRGQAAHVVDIQEQSQEPLDLVFVLDVSSSVRHDFKYLQAFVRKFIRRVLQGKKHSTHIGMVAYSREAHIIWNLNDESYNDKKVMLQAIKNMKVIGGGTNTGAGIEFAMSMEAKAKMKVIIVITDGEHNKGHRPWRIADQARVEGWHVMAIGVRGAPNDEILRIGKNELCFQVAEYKEVFQAFEKFVDPDGIDYFQDDAPEVPQSQDYD